MTLLERIVSARRASIARQRALRAQAQGAARSGPRETGAAGGEEAQAVRNQVRTSGSDVSPGQPRDWTPQTGAARGSEQGRASAASEGPEIEARRHSGAHHHAPPGGLSGRAGFAAALRAPGRRIIAEIKRRSPSAGILRDPLDPAEIASVYERAGAAALSVLTEPEFFSGSDADLSAARGAVRLPILRKDFVLDAEMLDESRAIGADAALLLASVLTAAELAALVAAARRTGIDALVEVTDERQLETALQAGAEIVGVNSRDLRDFTIDPARLVRLAGLIPDGVVRVAESGIRTRDDIARLEDSGYRAFLVGESLLRAPDPGAHLRELLR